jgi:serine/threonine-protein kinase ATR
LCKYEAKSDIRKETRVNQIIDHLNIVFAKDPECRRLNIRLPTYSIVYLGKKCVVIEWVNDTSTIKSILRTINPKSANLGGHTDPKVWAGIQDRIRPCFHQYFFQKYPEPNDWLIARNNYIRSLAAWSIFGYVIGLGDRHLENIMINNQSGSVMLIDFECIFDLGLTFTFPELVPFRLTPEIQTAMGLFFEEGEFIKTAVKVLACMKKNITSIMIQLECFVNDPLNIYISNPEYHSKNCDLLVTLKIIRARLEGYEKYAGTRVFLTDKEQVRFLVDKAKDPELLRKMFQGWAPWE